MSRVIVSDVSRDRYYSVNPSNNWFTETVVQAPQTEMGKPAITPDGGQVWLPLITLNQVAMYDTLSNTLVKRVCRAQ